MGSVSFGNYQRRIGSLLDTVENPANRATLQRYLDERRADGVKPQTLANDANNLRDLAAFLGSTRFEDVGREGITRFVNIRTRTRVWRSVRKDGSPTERRTVVDLGETTMSCRKAILRHFYKWLKGNGEEFPDEVRHLKVRRPHADSIPTDELLTADDMKRLIQVHMHPREKALLAVLYESGMRAGEICALNVGSYQRDEYGGFLLLPKGAAGLKTGARKVRLHTTESLQYLDPWWEVHPRKDEPGAPLFFTMSNRARGARMTPAALYAFVRRAGERAGLKKHVHPHLFRHTAATERARMGWKEAQMRAFFGWTRSSDMPSHYAHLSGADYEDMDLAARGLKAEKPASTTRGLRPVLCRVCKEANLPTAYFCHKCRQPISPEAEREIEAKRKEDMAEVLAKLLLDNNEGLREALAQQLIANR